jgi:hypothetical protein
MKMKTGIPTEEYKLALLQGYYSFYESFLGKEVFSCKKEINKKGFKIPKKLNQRLLDSNFMYSLNQVREIFNEEKNKNFIGLYDDDILIAFSRAFINKTNVYIPEIICIDENIINDKVQLESLYSLFLYYIEKNFVDSKTEKIIAEIPYNDFNYANSLFMSGFSYDRMQNNDEDRTRLFKKELLLKEEKNGQNLSRKQA